MTGSCAWSLTTVGLRDFLQADTNRILRIGGNPGSGKSTLSAFVIQHLQETLGADVLFFFCKGTDGKRQKPMQVVRTLISQLLIKDESLYPTFERLRMHSGREVIESFADLQDHFRLVLRSTTKPILHIVVDALDECQEGSELALFLIQCLTATRGIVKLILTCRNDPELLSCFPLHDELITSPTGVATPIHDYIRYRVSKNKYISATFLGRKVVDVVSSAANGSWLYARLMMDEIQRLPSPTAVERQLQNIPAGLAQVYLQIFTTMENSMSTIELRMAQQILLWMDLSDFVKVGRSALDHDVLDLVIAAETGDDLVFDSLVLAQQLCSPLISLSKTRSGHIKAKFFHHTAAQFIRDCSYREVASLPLVLKPQAMKGLYRASVSIWWFGSWKSTLMLERLRQTANSPWGEYFEMAYGLWAGYAFCPTAQTYSEEDITEMNRLIKQLTNFIASGAVYNWIEMAIIINYHGGWDALVLNVFETIAASEIRARSSIPILQDFSVVTKRFFEDYAWVISLTGPCNKSVAKPAGFDERDSAARLLSLGRKWSHLYTSTEMDGGHGVD